MNFTLSKIIVIFIVAVIWYIYRFIFDDKRDEELSDDMSVEIKKSVNAGISNHFTFFNSSDSTTTDIKNLLTTADIQDLEFGE